ncbi:MAG: nitroreductase [Micavibrio aeruginosavorus]|uniref:Putative NAD(P)H nitroreductase n=1 Tax=Micavibrio aeruginosavorus TaxID=349221 RepID=A0A2W5FRL0_9BACT|nr:MAG: nitroreductase [Micavibrio aeruginosavorus]
MPDLTDFLLKRRSTKIAHLADPAPSKEELETILKIASRVPDHGKYAPWYFMALQGDARREAGELLRQAYEAENADTPAAKLDLEAERFLRAPLVIAVVSRIKPGKHAQWEQILSAGASCMNLCLAANSLGYGANWLTEWYTYSEHFKASMGLDARDNFAGFIYIGTQTAPNDERERPALENIVTYWQPDAPSNKGDQYGMPDKDIPQAGFTSAV